MVLHRAARWHVNDWLLALAAAVVFVGVSLAVVVLLLAGGILASIYARKKDGHSESNKTE